MKHVINFDMPSDVEEYVHRYVVHDIQGHKTDELKLFVSELAEQAGWETLVWLPHSSMIKIEI